LSTASENGSAYKEEANRHGIHLSSVIYNATNLREVYFIYKKKQYGSQCLWSKTLSKSYIKQTRYMQQKKNRVVMSIHVLKKRIR